SRTASRRAGWRTTSPGAAPRTSTRCPTGRCSCPTTTPAPSIASATVAELRQAWFGGDRRGPLRPVARMIVRPGPLLAVALVVMAPVVVTAGAPEDGRRKAEPCAACHGRDGNATIPGTPSLAGHPTSYTHWQLLLFRNERRRDPQMTPIASRLTDEDMADL